jgi:hypothetical protein
MSHPCHHCGRLALPAGHPRSRALRPFASAPTRRFASDLERDGCVLRLVERAVVSPVFELVEDAVGEFGGLDS